MPEIKFIDLNEIIDKSAIGLFKNFEQFIEQNSNFLFLELEKPNLVGLCTDGANVMRGIYNGLVEKIRMKNPWIVGNFSILDIHCIAHQLHLVAEHAYQEF